MNEWFPELEDYTPELGVEDWIELLNDSSVFTGSSLKIVKRLKDYGGAATCKHLSVKYGENPNFYNNGSQSLAKRVAEKMGCAVMIRDTEKSRWWPILYVGKETDSSTDDVYIWKLRDELSEALEKVDLSEIPLYVDDTPAIWKISHGSISESNRSIFEDRKVAVVHSTTKAKAVSKVSQGESFIDSIKKGDYFYLCYGNSIRILGQFTTDKPVLNPEMEDGWYERSYRVISESKDASGYKGVQKWWSPNDNSTCIRVENDDQKLFEEAILVPYFDMTLSKLFGDADQKQGYWWLTRKAERLDTEIAELEERLHEAEVVQDDGMQDALETLDKFSGATELDQKIVQALVDKVVVYNPRHVVIRWKFLNVVLRLLQE